MAFFGGGFPFGGFGGHHEDGIYKIYKNRGRLTRSISW